MFKDEIKPFLDDVAFNLKGRNTKVGSEWTTYYHQVDSENNGYLSKFEMA